MVKNAELPEFRASLDTISKTANGIITDVEKHFAEVCKERGIELPKDTEYELVTIPPSREDALAFAAEYAAFLRRGLNVPDSADSPTAEAVADRLLAGEDAELRKELEDFVKLADEIGIDDGSHGLLERFNVLFRREWRAKEEPQPEVETEKLYLADDSKYVHVQRTVEGIDYTIYDAETMKALDGGQLDAPDMTLSAAALEVCKLHELGNAAPLSLVDSKMIQALQETNELPPLPELEQGYPMPDTAVGFWKCISTATRTAIPCCR